ncbi:MAG TPA: hypothetical protein ENJ16_02005 [Planctomycetaceae bacterium]|nr:hypothetical protein [Planctomycetaceae bacterium]
MDASLPPPNAIAPERLLRNVESALVIVPAGELSFQVEGWCDDGRTIEAPRIDGVVAGEVREVVLDFSGRSLTGRVVRLNGDSDVIAYTYGNNVWRARPLKIGDGGAFECTLDRTDVLVVLATADSCSVAFTDIPEREKVDLGRVVLTPRPVLGSVVVGGPSDSAAGVSLRPLSLQNAAGRWDGFGFRAPLAFRAKPGGVDVLALPGIVAARVVPQREGHYAVPESVEVRDGKTVACQLISGAVIEVWLVDDQEPGVRDFWLRDEAGKTYSRSSVRRTDAGAWARFAGLRPGRYTLVVRNGDLVASPVNVLTSETYELHATMR